MTKFTILPMLNNSEQIIIDSLKNVVEPRMLCLHICFLIRGIRWKTNVVGPLGLRWRKSNMAAMKLSPAGNMIIHFIVSPLVGPPKLQQKVYQRLLVNRCVLYDILKV